MIRSIASVQSSQVVLEAKNSPANARGIRDLRGVEFLGQEDPLGEGMATRSSIIAWRIPRPEVPGRLQSMGSQRVQHN